MLNGKLPINDQVDPQDQVDLRMARHLAGRVGETLERLLQPNLQRDFVRTGQPAFSIWLRRDRLVVSVDPLAVRSIDQVLSRRFIHHFSTALNGRKVVPSNTRGVYFQVSYWPAPKGPLDEQPLDLTTQPAPGWLPVGTSSKGPLWLALADLDAVLIGGSRGMGKSSLAHAWIQTLVHDGSAQLYLWDGKANAEFGRYAGEKVRAGEDLEPLLGELMAEVERRRAVFLERHVASLPEYNRWANPRLLPLVLIVDEAAFIPESCRQTIADLVARGRAWGVFPILATQRPGVSEVQALVKANLSTRIAFPVPSVHDSMIILGRPGAEKLPKKYGRMLVTTGARLVEVQAFRVELPQPEQARSGQVLRLLQQANQQGGRVTIAFLVEQGISAWNARLMLADWKDAGWVEKDPGADNAHCLTAAARSWLSQSALTDADPLKPSQ